jgi:hypothetical protein
MRAFVANSPARFIQRATLQFSQRISHVNRLEVVRASGTSLEQVSTLVRAAGPAMKPSKATRSPIASEQDAPPKQKLDAGAAAEDRVCTLRGQGVIAIVKNEFGVLYTLGVTYEKASPPRDLLRRPRTTRQRADTGQAVRVRLGLSLGRGRFGADAKPPVVQPGV